MEEFLAKLSEMANIALPLIPIIVGLVEFAKLVGLPSNAASAGLSIVLGIVLAVVAQVATTYPVAEPWILAVLSGALVGMAATGLYTIGARWTKR